MINIFMYAMGSEYWMETRISSVVHLYETGILKMIDEVKAEL